MNRPDTFSPATANVPRCPLPTGGGTGEDTDKAWRLDPVTGMSDEFVGLNGAYSYSDMTGYGLAVAGPPIVPVE